ncbi:MAG: hypothetical protein GF408_04805 [Candidatus Omnitrophica bacterium]|nr:hypothetical protein [Candidatus Omnitrophota bacterium]
MKPRKNYRSRPTKTGAKKVQRINSQKKRLVAMGADIEELDRMTTVEIRQLLKEMAKKTAKEAASAKSSS